MSIENIPQELKSEGLFCLWKYEKRNGKHTKPPYNPRTGRYAQSDNPSTFGPFNAVLSVCKRGNYEGVGIGIFNGFCAIDIDHCYQDGKLSDMANTIIEKMNSYTEISPSGNGIRIIFKAPGFSFDTGTYYTNNHKIGLEIYISGSTKKYVTLTGNILHNRPVGNRTEAIRWIMENYMKKPEHSPVTAQIDCQSNPDYLKRGLEHDTTLLSLWNGERPNGNESSDDLALFNKLAYWCNGDRKQMTDAFLGSPYYAQKDPEHRAKCERKDYIPRTIDEALADLRTTAAEANNAYSEHAPQKAARSDYKPAASDYKPTLVKASAIPYEPPRWLIEPYVQRGKGNLIQADNGTGKTALACSIAAHTSTGQAFLDSPVETPGDVLILSVEDDLPVLRGRIEANGGDLSKCYFMTNAAGLTFNSPEVEMAIKQINAKLVLFDPFQAFLGAAINMDKSNQTRPELARLFEMADRNDCAIIIIAHMGKGAVGSSAVNRSLGSVDIPAAMRSIIQVIRNPDENECIAVHVKCSNAPKGRSFTYTIGEYGGVRLVGYNNFTVEDLKAVKKRQERGVPYENEPLVQVFNQLMTDRPGGGFWGYSELKEQGMKILGFPPFSDTYDLKARLDSSFGKELQEHDGLIVTHGHRNKKERGIRIERYAHPKSYQTSLPTE